MDYLNKLKLYPRFTYVPLEKGISYETSLPIKVIENTKKYFHIDDFVKTDDEIEYICYLKNIVDKLLSFEGKELTERKYDSLNYLEIIKEAQKNGDKLNCRYKSFIFSQVLMVCGFMARWVRCLSMEPNDEECHCVTEVFSHKLNKWIVVDIAFNYLYFDSNGMLLNLFEMREKIIKGEKIRFISESRDKKLDTQQYLSKNLFRFNFFLQYKHGAIMNEEKNILLYPQNYDVIDLEKYSYITTNSALFW